MVEIVCGSMVEAGELIRKCERRTGCWDCVLSDVCAGGNTEIGTLRRIETAIRIAEGALAADEAMPKRGEAPQNEKQSRVAKIRQEQRNRGGEKRAECE